MSAPDNRTEAEILFPDRTLTLADGREVVARELSAKKSSALQGLAESLKVAEACTDDGGFSVERAIETFGAHFDWWASFVCASTGLSVDEFGELPNSAAIQIAALVIGVNGLFFKSIAATQSRKNMASPTPSRSSSDTDTPTLEA